MARDTAVTVISVPGDVHDDFLEAYLLLSGVRHMHLLCHGTRPPPSIGMLARNDLLAWAWQHLQEPWRALLFEYSDKLISTFCHRRHPSLPHPHWTGQRAVSEAEELARDILEEGTAPLWSAVRQVISLLQRETPRHQGVADQAEASSSTFGVYATGPFAGLCKLTLTHPNVVKLINSLVTRVSPEHRWTTVAVMFNYQTPPHRDLGNSTIPSLVTALSLHENGELWVEDPAGDEWIIHEGEQRRGFKYSLQLQALQFRSHQLHCTCEWASFDRVVLSAYTVSRWEVLQQHWQDQLADIGFYLPERKLQPRRPGLHQDCLPCVVR